MTSAVRTVRGGTWSWEWVCIFGFRSQPWAVTSAPRIDEGDRTAEYPLRGQRRAPAYPRRVRAWWVLWDLPREGCGGAQAALRPWEIRGAAANLPSPAQLSTCASIENMRPRPLPLSAQHCCQQEHDRPQEDDKRESARLVSMHRATLREQSSGSCDRGHKRCGDCG